MYFHTVLFVLKSENNILWFSFFSMYMYTRLRIYIAVEYNVTLPNKDFF